MEQAFIRLHAPDRVAIEHRVDDHMGTPHIMRTVIIGDQYWTQIDAEEIMHGGGSDDHPGFFDEFRHIFEPRLLIDSFSAWTPLATCLEAGRTAVTVIGDPRRGLGVNAWDPYERRWEFVVDQERGILLRGRALGDNAHGWRVRTLLFNDETSEIAVKPLDS
ncbi:MAG: hypothetical protein AB7V42_00100 [Thermoleophilia bacterium]